MSHLDNLTVLVLNRYWQAIDVKSPVDAFSMMAAGQATGLDMAGYQRRWVDWNVKMRQTDVDGTSTFSQTVAVQFLTSRSDVLVYPNPARGAFTIRFERALDSPVAVKLIDASGRVAAVHYMGTDRTAVFDPGPLAPGLYSLHIGDAAGGSVRTVQLLD